MHEHSRLFIATLASAGVLVPAAAGAAPYPSAILVSQPRSGLVEPLTERADALDLGGDLLATTLNSDLAVNYVEDLDDDGVADLLIASSVFGECGGVYLVPSTLRAGRALDAASIGEYVRYDGVGGSSPGDCGEGAVSSMEPIGDVNGDGVGDLWLARYLGEDVKFTGYIVFGRVDAGARIDLAAPGGGRVPSTGFPLRAGDLDGDGIDDLFYEPYAPIVVPGRTDWPETFDPLGGPPERTLVSFTRERDSIFFRPTPAGDVDGDGIADLLLEPVNGGSAFVIEGAPDLDVVFGSDADYERLAIYSECRSEPFSLQCPVGPVGDVDGDGFDDLGSFATILYGSPDGPPLASDAGPDGAAPDAGLTRLVGGVPFNGDDVRGKLDRNRLEFHPAGDLNGDGVDDFYLEDFLVVFGFPDGRPASVDTAALDGSDGFFVSDTYDFARGFAQASRPLTGDFDGDGIDDLIVFDSLISGRREDGTPPSPPDVRARFGPRTSDILWSAPTDDAGVAGYEVRLGGELVASVGADVTSVTLDRTAGDSVDDLAYTVASVGPDGRTSPPVARAFFRPAPDFLPVPGGNNFLDYNALPIEGLRAAVYGPGTLELLWNAVPQRYLGFRDGVPLKTVQANSLLERDLEPGREYGYFVTQGYGPGLDRQTNLQTDDTSECFSVCRPLEATFAAVGRSERVDVVAGDAGSGGSSGPQQPEPPVTGEPPATLAGLDYAVYSDTAAELFWERVTGDSRVVGYEVVRNGETVATRDATSYFDDSLMPNVRYDFSVAAIDDEGRRAAPFGVSFQTRGRVAPGESGTPGPTGLRVDVYSSTATELFWDRARQGGVRYEVLRDGSSIGETDGTSFFDDAFERARGARYGLVAIGPGGTRSAPTTLVVEGTR